MILTFHVSFEPVALGRGHMKFIYAYEEVAFMVEDEMFYFEKKR